MLKKVLLGVLAVVLIVAIGGGYMMVSLGKQTDAVMSSLSIKDVDLASVADGTYTGEFDAKLVYAKVRTTVKNHRIVSVEILEHRNGRGKAGEQVTSEIVAKQSLTVDGVSGATISSKVITKAVELSLRKP